MKPADDVEVEGEDGAEEEASEEKVGVDERAADMECKNVGALQAIFENKTTKKCIDVLKSVDDNDCIADVDTVNYDQLQLGDFELNNEENIEYDESKNVQSTNIEVGAESKLSHFSNTWYAIERILHCKSLNSIAGFDQQIEENVKNIVKFAFKCMHMKERESDMSVTNVQKVKSLT